MQNIHVTVRRTLYCETVSNFMTVIPAFSYGGVENQNLLSHPDDLRMEAYVIRMT